MINLDPGCDNDVALQFKHASYYMAHHRGHYVPMPQNPQEGGPPQLVDYIEGRLHKEGEQYLLKYANPAEPSTHLDLAIDPDDVARMWILRRVISPIIAAP